MWSSTGEISARTEELRDVFPCEGDISAVLGLNVQKCRKKRLKVRLVICIASHFKEMGRILEKVNMQTRNI